MVPALWQTVGRHFPGLAAVRVRPLNGARVGAAGVAAEQEPTMDEDGEGEVDAAIEVEPIIDPALARFEVSVAGWSKLANYALDFWAELLEPAAFLTWMAIRREDTRRTKTEWTPAMSVSASRLALLAAAGNRQAITGVWRTCRAASMVEGGEPCPRCAERGGRVVGSHRCRFRKPGALDRLQAEGLAIVGQRGEGLHVTYRVRVFALPPLMTPAQVADLCPSSQECHSRWLLRQGLDLESWERLTVRHLALPPL
jgi:hypothetical protein